MRQPYYIYTLASRSRRLYTGVTNDLQRRVVEHREGKVAGFTKQYKIFRLVHYEVFGDIRMAIAREKKVRLIERNNRTWEDLAEALWPDMFGKG